jgi:autotransporter-associated beta strand protein
MILTDSSSAYAGSNQVRTIASFGSNLYHFTTYADTTLSRVVSGTGIGILKNGPGTLTLSASNTYTGNATISAGVMSIINTGALPGFNTNGRFAVAPNATLAVYNAVTDAEVTTLRNTTNFRANAAIGFDTTSGNRTYTPTLNNTAQGALGVTKLGQNTLIIPTAGTYTGTTSVLVGTLSTFGANIVPDSSPVFLDTNGTLVLGGADTLATISGRGTLNCQSNNITLNSNNNSTFSGLLTSIANSGNCIYKTGTNTITLSGATIRISGPMRSDTGGWTLAGNTSFIQSRTSDGPRNFHMAINAGNTFNLTISGGASLTTAGCMFGDNNGGSATVNLLSGSTWTSNQGGGQSWMAGLSSILNIDGGAYSASLFYIGGGAAAQNPTSIINLNSGSFSLNNSLVWQGAGRCVFNLNGGTATFANFQQATVTDNTFNFNGGTFTTLDADYNYSYGAIKYITNSGNAVFFARPTRTITLTNAISGVGGIVKNGTGTLSLGAAASTFTGQVSANEGTISTSTATLNDSTNGPFGNNTLPVVLGSSGKSATLAYTGGANVTWTKGVIIPTGATGIIDNTTGTNNITLNGSVSGSGILVKNGTGGLILGSTNNPYSGGTIHNNGLLAPTYNNSLGTGNISFNGGSIRSDIIQDVSLNNTSSLSSNTTFPTIASEKSLTLLGANTIFGSTKTLTVNTGTTVAGKYINFAGSIGDNGNNYGIIKSGTGTLVLSGNNTYGGNTTISDGTLTLANANGFGTVGEIRFTSDSIGVLSFAVPSDISSRIRNNTNRLKLYGDNNTTVSLTSLGSSNTGGLTVTGQGTGNIILSGSGNSIVTNNAGINCNSGNLTFADSISSRPVINVSGAANATGTVNISGTFIQTNAGGAVRTWTLGEFNSTSTGTLNIYNSGYLQLSGGIMLAGNTAGTGILNLYNGGYLKMAPTGSTGELWIAGNSTLNVYGGTIDQSGGAAIYNGGGGTGGTATTNFNISAGSVTCNTYNIGIGQATNVTANTNLAGGTFSIAGFDFRNTAGNNVYNFYYNGGTFNIRNTTAFPALSNVVTTVRSGGAIFNINAGATVTHSPALLNGTGGGGLTKLGSGILSLSAINTYTGTTNISAGTLRVLKKISGTGSDASFTQADFTPTTLSVTFVAGTPPSVGNTFRLFSGDTLQTYGSVSLVNYAGTASYNSTDSTLTINT